MAKRKDVKKDEAPVEEAAPAPTPAPAPVKAAPKHTHMVQVTCRRCGASGANPMTLTKDGPDPECLAVDCNASGDEVSVTVKKLDG